MTGNKENPKLIQARKLGKDPLELLVTAGWADEAKVMALGASKYGPYNWREDHIRATTYKGAILRHLRAYFDGEDLDPESGVSHLAHIRACCAIMQDAAKHNTLIDDRI